MYKGTIMKKLLLILLLSKMVFGPSVMIDINAIKKQNLEKQKETELLNAKKKEEIALNDLVQTLYQAFAELLQYDFERPDKNKDDFSKFKKKIHTFLLGTINLDAESIMTMLSSEIKGKEINPKEVLKKYGIEWSPSSEGSVCVEKTNKNEKGEIINSQISCFLKAQLAEKI
jgi:hypothetical protein